MSCHHQDVSIEVRRLNANEHDKIPPVFDGFFLETLSNTMDGTLETRMAVTGGKIFVVVSTMNIDELFNSPSSQLSKNGDAKNFVYFRGNSAGDLFGMVKT